MNLGDQTSFEAWVLRDGVWSVLSTGFGNADAAFQRARYHHFPEDRIQVVRVRTVRSEVFATQPQQEGPKP